MEWSGRLSARALSDTPTSRSCASLARRRRASCCPNSFASAWLVQTRGHSRALGLRRRSAAVVAVARGAAPGDTRASGGVLPPADEGAGHREWPARTRARRLDPRRRARRASCCARQGGTSSRPFVVMAPGAAYGGAKRWPSEHFADVATRLVRDRSGACCVLIGSAADGATTRWVRALVPEDARAQHRRSRRLDDARHARRRPGLASACVSNDSGAMHLAGAVGVPLAALFGPTRERETAPLVAARPVAWTCSSTTCGAVHVCCVSARSIIAA